MQVLSRLTSNHCQTVALHVCGLAHVHVLAATVHSGLPLHCDHSGGWEGWAAHSLVAISSHGERKKACAGARCTARSTVCPVGSEIWAWREASQNAGFFTARQGGVAPSLQRQAKPQRTAIAAARLAGIVSHEKTHGTSKLSMPKSGSLGHQACPAIFRQ